MPTIHIPGDGHLEPGPLADGTSWFAWDDEDNRKILNAALWILQHNIKGLKPCNDCFKRLPNGKSFDEILADPATFISFDPVGPNMGFTIGNDVTISITNCNNNRWQVAATLVLEFAHVNGVTSADDAVAESMLRCCGLSGHVH
jgi:hypothetical protein